MLTMIDGDYAAQGDLAAVVSSKGNRHAPHASILSVIASCYGLRLSVAADFVNDGGGKVEDELSLIVHCQSSLWMNVCACLIGMCGVGTVGLALSQ